MPSSSVPARAAPAPLTSEQLASLRSALEEQRAFRVEQLAQLRHPGQLGPLSCADAEVLRSLRDAARAALHEVQRALWRMSDGSYGRCTACGEALGLARLEVVPQTALCMPCQREADAVDR
ncbi:MAG TPA: TraR/DksA C4-type zinc finger protein [Jatrophihabitans sp.]|nr:TraR/DksA C4-type zinc finger protein [Jatrophihabitans sp.]